MADPRQLSRSFHADEFVSRDGAPLPADYLAELRALCLMYLQPLRDRFGRTIVHSGHRSDRRNAAVGGAPRSRHLDLPGRAGAAADVSCARGTPAEWYRFLDARGIPGLGLYPTHVHADNRHGRARW